VTDLRERLARAAWNALPATPYGWDAADQHTRDLWLNVADGLLPVVRNYAADEIDALGGTLTRRRLTATELRIRCRDRAAALRATPGDPP
jgi:hypothetical protein